MAELDKTDILISDLEDITEILDNNGYGMWGRRLEDAVELLKKQKAVEPDTDSEGTCTCGNCGETVGYYPVGCNKPEKLCKFCPECGQAVKWE